MAGVLMLADSATTGWVVVHWSANPPMLQRFKNMVPWKDRGWDSVNKQWTMTAEWVPQVIALARRHGFRVENRRKCDSQAIET
jgi:hypothetical protein